MANQFHVGQGYFRIGDKFDSRNSYIRKVSILGDATLYMCRGPSLAINTTPGGQAGWRWQVGPIVRDSDTGIGVPFGFNTTLYIAI